MPTRLGLDGSVSSDYLIQINSLFRINASVGIAGGRDREAYYLVGLDNAYFDLNESSASSLYYLDPHIIQSAIPADWQIREEQ